MYNFFVKPENISDKNVLIVGSDVNHIKNVLRMKIGEKITVSDGNGASNFCSISEINNDNIIAGIESGQKESSELPVKLVLFQGLPKSDKMELIIQKAVELGASEIVPVEMARCIVKLDEKKKKSKLTRWQSISESAAKQSGRMTIPKVCDIMKFTDAVERAKNFDMFFVPYECSDSVAEFKEKLGQLKSGQTVGIFIGPEGGYEASEVEEAEKAGGKVVSLGKRILRTETAGITALSICMFYIEANL